MTDQAPSAVPEEIHPLRRRRPTTPRVVAACVPVAVVVLLLLDGAPLGQARVLAPIFLTMLIVLSILAGILLVEQYRTGGSPRLAPLSCAFGWAALLFSCYGLALPGFWSPGGVLGDGAVTASWLWAAGHAGMITILTVSLMPWPEHWSAPLARPHRRLHRVLACQGVVSAAGVATTAGVVAADGRLPTGPPAPGSPLSLAVLALTVAAVAVSMAGILRRGTCGLECWAFVSLSAFAGGAALDLLARGPQTLAWYGARGLTLVASVVVLLALVHEITKLYGRVRRDAEQLALSNAGLREAQSLRDHLVAVASHDMRTPLAGVSGYLELLDDLLAGQDRPQRMVRRSQHLARRLTLHIEDMLAVATAGHAGRSQELQVERVGLARQLHQAASGFPDRDVRVRCPEPVAVHVDPLRLQQVIDNLIGNALKYGAEPVRVGGSQDGDQVSIVVADAGDGVPTAFVDRLFERYTRAGGSTAPGSGLGLSVVRDLVEAHGGSVHYDVDVNAFVVVLPAAEPFPASGAAGSRPATSGAALAAPVGAGEASAVVRRDDPPDLPHRRGVV